MAEEDKPDRSTSKTNLLRQLAKAREVDRAVVDGATGTPRARLLALWQSRRLAVTYEEFREQPRYTQAVDFFLNDLYGPRDFSQRDADVEKLFPMMSKLLPSAALDALSGALELHALTQQLDAHMLAVLTDKLGLDKVLTPELWAEAYRQTGRRPDREQQIALTVRAGRQLDVVVTRPLVFTLVVLARGPARAAGFGELQDFVERGFRAFRGMRGAGEFVDAVEARETDLMEKLFAGEAPAGWARNPGTVSLADLSEQPKTGD